MQKFFRIVLAGMYITAALVVLINQADTARDELEKATRSTASQLSCQGDARWATDPHFSHAKKTGRDSEFSTVPLLRLTLTSAAVVQQAVRSDRATLQNPRSSRAPPLFS